MKSVSHSFPVFPGYISSNSCDVIKVISSGSAKPFIPFVSSGCKLRIYISVDFKALYILQTVAFNVFLLFIGG